MTQNFVIAFGGTGARCVEALTYVFASDAIRAPAHVLVVDPDATNGNVDRALSQLRRYYAINRVVQPTERDGDRPFFSTPLNGGLGDESFFWANPNPNAQFKTLIDYNAQGAESQALLELLYDEDDLDLTFEKGYIGRAHIGSIDLLRTLEKQISQAASVEDLVRRPDSMVLFFRALREAAQQTGGARLMVIGSVFGGTGASGLPAVPPLLRKALGTGLQRQLAIGCIQVAPYFSFPQGGPEDPDSALHPLATQAALYHYALTDTGYDRIYLVGAPGREQANDDNVVGGDAQLNMAHYVELASALAAAHFFQHPPSSSASTEVMACGATEVGWDKLPFCKETNLKRRLVAFGTFCMMHARYLAQALEERRHRGGKWMDDLTAGGGRDLGGHEAELRSLRDFARRFLEWARQVQRISGVDLFTISEHDSEEALAAVAPRGTSKRPYHDLYEGLNTIRPIEQATGAGWYVEALSRASLGFCEANYR